VETHGNVLPISTQSTFEALNVMRELYENSSPRSVSRGFKCSSLLEILKGGTLTVSVERMGIRARPSIA